MQEQDCQKAGDTVEISAGEFGVAIFYWLFWSAHAIIMLNPIMPYMWKIEISEALISNSVFSNIASGSIFLYLYIIILAIWLLVPLLIFLTRLLCEKSQDIDVHSSVVQHCYGVMDNYHIY